MIKEISIPRSAATKNLYLSLSFALIALAMSMFNIPMWLICLFIGIAGGFLLLCISCILDIQEFMMHQNQKIIELLIKEKKHD